jgi:hypothetical protein
MTKQDKYSSLSSQFPGRDFSSPYAPLTPDGPLPPGVTEAAVVNAYKSFDLRPKRVLATLNIKHFKETPARRLRKALNQAEGRLSRRGVRPPFHNALYRYLRRAQHAHDIYHRVVQPAEYDKDDAIYIDPQRFRRLVEAEREAIGKRLPSIAPSTDLEALAHFVLAFALLQTDERYEILEPVLLIGQCFQEFFGVNQKDPTEVLVSDTTPRDATPTDSVLTVSTENSLESKSGPAPISTDIGMSETRAVDHQKANNSESSSAIGRHLGPRQAQLTLARSEYETLVVRRRELGGALVLDELRLKEAIVAERSAAERIQHLIEMSRRELNDVAEKIKSQLSAQGIHAEIDQPEAPDEHAICEWLDQREGEISEIAAMLENLKNKRANLMSMKSIADLPLQRSLKKVSLDEILHVLRTQSLTLDQQLAEALSWKSQMASVKKQMVDCLSPKKSRSIMNIDSETAILLLKQAQFDESFEPLFPLLVRLLAENHRLISTNEKYVTSELLGTVCNIAARGGDVETHQELLSYLTKEILLEALSTGNEVLIRHVLILAFRDSIARRQPFFFEDIWPFEAWGRRTLVVGERLLRFFNGLHQLYWRTMSVSTMLQVLVTQGVGVAHADENEQRLAVIRRKAAEDLAVKLETPGMTGHFHRLRSIASTRYFKPLTPSIRGRRVREVRIEHFNLEKLFASGELETETVTAFGDKRELRTAHYLSLKRYLESNLHSIKEWIQQEAALEQEFKEDDLITEIHASISRLPDDDETRFPSEVGSIEWLEKTVVSLISSLRQNQFPDAAFAFLGNLPTSDTLFNEPGSTATQPALWPSWIDRNPKSERIWVCHLRGNLSWEDLLQDGIAKILLGRQRSEREILESFIQSGEFEAAIEASRFPGFSSNDLKPLVEQAQHLFFLQGNVERKVYDLDERLRQLLQRDQTTKTTVALKQQEVLLLQPLDDLEKLSLEAAFRKTEQIERSISDIEIKIRDADQERSARLALLKSWFAGSEIVLPELITVEEAERLADVTRYQEKSRRLHLTRLKEFDAPGVPEELREIVRDYLRAADRPARWPDKDAAERAELYIEYLIEISRGWWSMLRGLDPQDVTFRKIQEIAALLGDRLSDEIGAITNGQTERALMLTLLFDGPNRTVSDYYERLQQKQLIRSDSEESSRETRRSDTTDHVDGWLQAQTRVEKIIEQSEIPAGSGQTVQDAYLAFGDTRYEDSRDLAISAWKTVDNPSDRGSLAAIYAWSCVQTRSGTYEHAETDAVGLLISNEARIRYRTPLVEAHHLLYWWVKLIDPEVHVPKTANIGEWTAGTLLKLVDSPAGANIRERFNASLHVTDVCKLATLLWEGVRNLRDETTKARTALLTLLFDFGEEKALDHLFEYTGNKRKYLSAFTALVMRARSDPSPKLHSAIIQNLRTLQTLKDRPFKDFAEAIARRIHYVSGRIHLEVSQILEQRQKSKVYTLVASIAPDESDPPLSLSLHLLDSEDFVCVDDDGSRKDIVKETLLFERQEVEFLVRPQGGASVFSMALKITGETASGQALDEIRRFRVELGTEDAGFEAIPINEILDIYEGYDAKPVSGAAFVGREEELKILERAVCRADPGAVVLYGARRLGKTSLLNEVQGRYCLTSKKGSRTLFLSVPVDEFSLGDTAKPFLERFFRHIWNSILHDFKNRAFRELFESWGVSREEFQSLGRFGDAFDDASFLMRLRELLQRVRKLSNGRVDQIVFVMDEFDKLLEFYRKGHEADVEELTNQLRRAATEEENIGIILAGSDLMRNVVGQYRNALYGSASVILLECFDGKRHRSEARRIVAPETLRGRRIFSEAVLDELVKVTGGHPLYLRLVACGAAWLTRKRHVSRGDVIESVHKLLRNDVLQGFLPDPPNLVVQPLQALRILDRKDQILSEILLRQIARHTTIESSGVLWGTIAHDDRLLNLRPVETWTTIRDYLREANLLFQDERRQWVFRYPILGERLRVDLEIEMERLQAEAASLFGLEVG